MRQLGSSMGASRGGGEEEEMEEVEEEEAGYEPRVPGPMAAVEDEAEVFEGLRTAFPVTFGKQESRAKPLEQLHRQTKREKAGGASGKMAIKFKVPARLAAMDANGAQLAHAQDIPGRENVAGSVVERREAGRAGDLAEAVGPPPPSLPVSSARGEDEEEREEDDGAMVGPPRPPPAVGGGREGEESEEEEDEVMVGPLRPPALKGTNGKKAERMMEAPRPPASWRHRRQGRGAMDGEDGGDGDEEDEEDDDDDEDEGDEDEYRVPMSNEIVLKGHSKVVVALAVDPTGSRVLTGSYDNTLRMWDFQGMTAKLASFRQLEPAEGHQVRALSWSPTADLFLAVSGSAQAKVYNRDGFTQGEFVKGDMYIRDLKNTKGHISGLTAGEWHPNERHTALTSSEDGSVRIWDTANFKTQKQVIKPKLARPGRVAVTSCSWGPDGKAVAAGLQDGSLQVWQVKAGWGSRPDSFLADAHEKGDEVTAVLFSADGSLLASRSTDATLKLWDLRKFKQPLASFLELPNSYGQTNIAWSPDEKLLFTGTSAEKEGPGGQLVFFDKDRLELVRRTGVSPSSVVRVAWQPRLNQIFATIGDKKQGGTHVLYDPKFSERGALVPVARAPRQPRAEDLFVSAAPPRIHNPHALPLFREGPQGRKRQREKARQDPVASKRPELPMDGPGHGGRVGRSKGSLLTQYLLREGGLKKEIWMDEDPREAILKYAEEAASDPQIIAPAYAETQPKPVFYESDKEEED